MAECKDVLPQLQLNLSLSLNKTELLVNQRYVYYKSCVPRPVKEAAEMSSWRDETAREREMSLMPLPSRCFAAAVEYRSSL